MYYGTCFATSLLLSIEKSLISVYSGRKFRYDPGIHSPPQPIYFISSVFEAPSPPLFFFFPVPILLRSHLSRELQLDRKLQTVHLSLCSIHHHRKLQTVPAVLLPSPSSHHSRDSPQATKLLQLQLLFSVNLHFSSISASICNHYHSRPKQKLRHLHLFVFSSKHRRQSSEAASRRKSRLTAPEIASPLCPIARPDCRHDPDPRSDDPRPDPVQLLSKPNCIQALSSPQIRS